MTAPQSQPDANRPQESARAEEPDEAVSSYDDLVVFAGPTGQLVLECPGCGSIPIPLRATTLSDLTNTAMDHLSAHHPYSLTLPSTRTKPTRTAALAAPDSSGSPGYFTDHFWSLVGLLSDEGAGVEALVRALASSSEQDILTFHQQLTNAVTLLDTPAHRGQEVRDLDDTLQTRPAAMSEDVFAKVRLAVVASGRDVWLAVLARPARLAGPWSLQSGETLLNAPTAALTRITGTAAPTATRAERPAPATQQRG